MPTCALLIPQHAYTSRKTIETTQNNIKQTKAVHFAREGADVFIVHAPGEEKDAAETEALVQKEGRRCGRLAGDVGSHEFARAAVERCVNDLGRLDCLVNNVRRRPRWQLPLFRLRPAHGLPSRAWRQRDQRNSRIQKHPAQSSHRHYTPPHTTPPLTPHYARRRSSTTTSRSPTSAPPSSSA